jgi:hypothetical protein
MKFRYIVFVMIVLGMFALVSGCIDPASDPAKVNPVSVACHPNDYTNGVYYFPCYNEEFGNSLSVWKKQNPDQVVTAIAVSDRGGYGYTIGYFVSTEQRIGV